MTSPSSARDDAGRRSPILVLVNPQDIVNIASAVRIAKNFGIERMRLVDPEVFDPWRIEGIAHNTADFVARIEILPSLEAAIADCVSTFVLTGRERAAKRRTLRPREAAAELVGDLAAGAVALVAGREDSGLTNAELAMCAGWCSTYRMRGRTVLSSRPTDAAMVAGSFPMLAMFRTRSPIVRFGR